MAPTSSGLQITRQRPGHATGETVYTCEDGSRWVSRCYEVELNMGESRGTIVGDRIQPK